MSLFTYFIPFFYSMVEKFCKKSFWCLGVIQILDFQTFWPHPPFCHTTRSLLVLNWLAPRLWAVTSTASPVLRISVLKNVDNKSISQTFVNVVDIKRFPCKPMAFDFNQRWYYSSYEVLHETRGMKHVYLSYVLNS